MYHRTPLSVLFVSKKNSNQAKTLLTRTLTAKFAVTARTGKNVQFETGQKGTCFVGMVKKNEGVPRAKFEIYFFSFFETTIQNSTS